MSLKNNLYASIILAGGYSSRMTRFKPLLHIGDETVADRVISLFLQNDVDTYLVTGWNASKLEAGIKSRDARIIHNPDYDKGMFSTIKIGVSHLKAGYKGFFILPVDIPLVRTSTVKTILSAATLYPDKIIYPVFNKFRGHPPVIPASLIPVILNQNIDSNLKDILKKYKENELEVKVADQNILLDIDSPEDYQAALRRFQKYDIPSEEECEYILSDICMVSPERRRHCIKVSELACKIGNELLKAGRELDPDIIHAATLLHDIAKGKPKHDLAGGQILRDLGFEKVAELISIHSDIPEDNSNISLETKIVFLADKLVKGDTIVSLDERYLTSDRPFTVTPEIEAIIHQRKLRAVKVKQEIESLLGYPLEKI
jgi:molybdenum cofactor cytidylyltransferase